MIRRSILQLHYCRKDKRVPVEITAQVPSYLSSRKAFSTKPQHGPPRSPGSSAESPKSGSILSKIVVGTVAIGAMSIAAYQTGYLDKYISKVPQKDAQLEKLGTHVKPSDLLESSKTSQADEPAGEQIAYPSFQESNASDPIVDQAESKTEATTEVTASEDSSVREDNNKLETNEERKTKQDVYHVQEEHLPSELESTGSENSSGSLSNLSEGSPVIKDQEVAADEEHHVTVEKIAPFSQDDTVPEHSSEDLSKDDLGNSASQPSSLLNEYLLSNKVEEAGGNLAPETQDVAETIEDAYVSKDGKLVLDFLQAIHAAEQRQAELDAATFAAEKKIMKGKYEKELRDSRARELMYAEREAILEKELNKERVKAAAALKSLQEKLEERHKNELQEQETEAELKEKKLLELAKAELGAAIAKEKASQIEKMAEANLNIDALCMAFYARSEEARHSHSIHKLALGALALEDALSRGLPIQKEVATLHTYLEDIQKDSLLDLVLSSLPKETLNDGTDTLLQLNHKFDALKGTLRHFSFIPLGGGGILAHSLASVASSLKVREANQSGDGIESLITRVESFLAQGKLSEAAEALENGVKGTQASEVVVDWVRRARNRAITEQALTVLQSYATAISLT